MPSHLTKTAHSVITVDNVDFAYNENYCRRLDVLRHLSFVVGGGEFISLLGPSGCGKTTLLRIIARLLVPASGTVTLAESQSEIGYVFQTPNLFPWLNVRENVLLPLRTQPEERVTNAHDSSLHLLLAQLGLESYEHLYPWQLSLGMQMRTNLGRALIIKPRLLLLDEPFSALDAITALKLQRDVLQIWREERVTCVLVTHNIFDAISMSDRVLLLSSRPAGVLREYKLPANRRADGIRAFDSQLEQLSKQIVADMESGNP